MPEETTYTITSDWEPMREKEIAQPRILAAPAGTPDWEGRTDFLEDPEGLPYQWIASCSDGRLHLSMRKRGSRRLQTVASIPARDAGALSALLKVAAERIPAS